jgi:hypothetical protein
MLLFGQVRPASHLRDDESQMLWVVLGHPGEGMTLNTAIQIKPAAFAQSRSIGMLAETGAQKRRGDWGRVGRVCFAASNNESENDQGKEKGDQSSFHQNEKPKIVRT